MIAYMTEKSLRLSISMLRKCLHNLLKLERKFNFTYDDKHHKQRILHSAKKHHMASSDDEQYYLLQYQSLIFSYLDELTQRCNNPLSILDLGCGQGRIAQAIAEQYPQSQITGIDLSAIAIQQAKERDKTQRIDYRIDSIESFSANLGDDSQDIIIILEVIYMLPNYKKVLMQLSKALKPGGILIVNFRPQYFNILLAIQTRQWQALDILLTSRSGMVWGDGCWFNWHTIDDIKALIAMLSLELCEIKGIGTCSGLPGDPHSILVTPSQLNNDEKVMLHKVETHFANHLFDASRYIVAVARKNGVRSPHV